MANPVQMGVGKRITIVDKVGAIGNGSNGQSLRGLDVNAYPDAALFYVRDSARMYRLKKNQSIAIVEDTTGMDNVVNGLGSNHITGRFVALVQMGVGTLAGGESESTVIIPGFDLNPGGWFHVSYSNGGSFTGTPGFLSADVNSETEVAVVSSSTSDGNQVFVTYYQTPENE